MVECAGLEIRYTVIPYRGFKSHSFRQIQSERKSTSGHDPDWSPALGSSCGALFWRRLFLQWALFQIPFRPSLMTPQHIIEAALLSSRRPMPVREIRRLFDDRLSAKSVKEHLAELQAFWEDRGMRLVELSDGWRFQTASELGPRFLRLDEEKPPRYSRAAMETLAIIAYHQPVTRGDIEELRGVTVNPATLRLFEERGWIETVGYRESPGRPALLATTRTFLNDLGLRSLAELPGPDAEPLPDFLLSEALPPSAAADEGPMPLQKEIDFEKQQ